MFKKIGSMVCNAIIVAFVALVLIGLMFLMVQAFVVMSGHYFYGSKVNGKLVSYKTEQEVADSILHAENDTFTIQCPDSEVVINIDEFATRYLSDDISVAFSPVDYSVKPMLEVDMPSLIQILQHIYEPYQNATISIENDQIVLNKDIRGCEFDVVAVGDKIAKQLYGGVFSLDITDYCRKPAVTVDDLDLVFKDNVWRNDFVISYTCGITVSGVDFFRRDEDTVIAGIVEKLKDVYDTKETSRTFTTFDGKTISVDYKTWGKHINVDKETAHIKNLLEQQTSEVDRKPYTYGYSDFGDTYIEVSIENQHVIHWVDGKVCCESDCVTGTKGKHDTPTGLFYVSERIPGKNLVGDNYTTWVNRWMRLTNSGVGLHDAYWRGSFGKNIYTYNGSHGCVNLPSNYAYKLFDEISTGIPTVIY